MKSLKLGLIALVIFITAVLAPETRAAIWELNDVTYVFPLPVTETLSVAIRASDLDPTGNVLIPIDLIKPLVQSTDGNGKTFFVRFDGMRPGDILPRSKEFDTYQDLFAVALRIDPCFRDQFGDACRKQIRVIWQPVDHWREGRPESVDAAVHTFYDLTEKEFATLLIELQTLKSNNHIDTTGLPIGIHPGFSSDYPSDFQRAFRALVLPYLGAPRIRRLAKATLEVSSAGWDLFSTDFLKDGSKRAVQIFPGDVPRQQTFNIAGIKSLGVNGMPVSSQNHEDFEQAAAEIATRKINEAPGRAFRGVVLTESTLPERGDQLLMVFRDSAKALDSPAKMNAVFGKATRIENPSLHLPGTIDCVSCHIANSVKTLTGSKRQIADSIPRFSRHYNLENNSKYYGDSHTMRMLGYLYDQVQFGDRVIYESAAVADRLNKSSRSKHSIY